MEPLASARAMITGLLLCASTFASNSAVESPDFTIEVVLSEPAKAYLLAHSDTVGINISFADIIGPGWHYLGGVKRELVPAISTSLQIRNVDLDSKESAALKTPNYEVSVNVFSSRRSFDMNVLDCDSLQGHIGNLQRKVHTLRCELGKWAPK